MLHRVILFTLLAVLLSFAMAGVASAAVGKIGAPQDIALLGAAILGLLVARRAQRPARAPDHDA